MWTSVLYVLIFAGISVDQSNGKKVHYNLKLLPKTCGKIVLSENQTFELSGQPANATLGQLPWVALLGYKDNGKMKYKCYGALISKRYIVTTTKCAMDCSYGVPLVARLGEVNITTEKGCTDPGCAPNPQDIEIEDILINAKFRKNWKNDVALLRLKSNITLNQYVSPICLPLNDETAKGDLMDQEVIVSNWKEASNRPTYPHPMHHSKSSFRLAGGAGGGGDAAEDFAEEAAAPEPAAEDDGDAAETTTMRPKKAKNCRRCNRLRGLGYLQYFADLVVDDLECRSQFGQGIECADCQYSTEGTMCTEVIPYTDDGGFSKSRCSRQIGSPVAYYSETSRSFYLVGLVLHSMSNCRFAAPVISTKIADHFDFIMSSMKP